MTETPQQCDAALAPLDLTVMAPAHNEAENVVDLVTQIDAAVAPLGVTYEILIVDDGSTDDTRPKLVELMATFPNLRCLGMTNTPPGSGNGQSAAFSAGFKASRGHLIALLDADLQNDPADIPEMLKIIRASATDANDPWVTSTVDFVQGDRSRNRNDNFIKRRVSVVGRLFRRMILGDTIRDTGCSLRVLKREIAVRIPLEFKGMHRFIPISARKMGYTVVEMEVRHHARNAGETKYGKLGITKRAIPGLMDCFAVRWMSTRRRPVTSQEIGQPTRQAAADSSTR